MLNFYSKIQNMFILICKTLNLISSTCMQIYDYFVRYTPLNQRRHIFKKITIVVLDFSQKGFQDTS